MVGPCPALLTGGFDNDEVHRIDEVLSGVSEADKVLYSCDEFVILPDMKWDLRTISALYLVAIARNGQVKSLRDLEGKHLSMLKAIRHEGQRVVRERWGSLIGGVRMYVHYQPSYCKLLRLDCPFCV
jgi:m7GpppX diphosphatase